jgi:BCD family chlorophyll transporter-like MFS transporter
VTAGSFGWIAIVRLGLVQAAIGSVVVLTTSTMNRVMVVELALPAIVPGLLVALHYGVQLLRPRLGWGSDQGRRRTPWILGGMALLGLGGVGVALAIALYPLRPLLGAVLAVAAFLAIGIGVGACGTAMLVLLSKRVTPRQRPAAATVTWVMMIMGFILTTVLVAHFLDPYSPARLVRVTACVAAVAFLSTLLAVWDLEGRGEGAARPKPGEAPERAAGATSFRAAFADVWGEPESRRLAIVVFVSMLAYSAQDLILEPFAGAVFHLTPAETTGLAGIQNGGVLCGMMILALVGSGIARGRFGSMRAWTSGGCIASALALLSLAAAGSVGPGWPLRASVFLLGVANGTYAVSAIGSMMERVGRGTAAREGVRMGVWGAAQAIAYAVGGLCGTLAVDLARLVLGSPVAAYSLVFATEALLFLLAGVFALRLREPAAALRPGRELGVRAASFEPSGLIVTDGGRT